MYSVNGSENSRVRVGSPMVVAVPFIIFTLAPAQAAEFNIANGDVPGLIAAINTANANGEADVINLAPGGTYTLTAPDNNIDGMNGLPSIASDITINGDGATIERSSADGTPEFRIFRVSPGAHLAVHDATIQNGLATGELGEGSGGAFRNEGTLTLSRCDVVDNGADDDGGAIEHFGDGRLTLSHCMFVGNTSRHGGAIYNAPLTEAVIEHSTFDQNRGGLSAGAIFSAGSLTMSSVTITGNYGGSGGGAILNSVGYLRIDGGTIAGNRADYGGGIVGGGRFELQNCVIQMNEAFIDGGGLRCNSGSDWTADACTVSRNTADTGAGISMFDATVVLIDCEFDGNSASEFGGGISTQFSNLLIVGSVISDCFSRLHGGGIFSRQGIVRIENSTVTSNSAGTTGGGIHATNQGVGDPAGNSIALTHCTVIENSAQVNGGGIYATTDAAVILSNSIVAASTNGDCVIDGTGVVTDAGFNIIEDGSCIAAPTSFAADPMLGPLADNGGPTLTHALLPGSPAIDAGDCDGGTVLEDQRGISRPYGAGCDIGAYEVFPGCAIPDPVPDGDVQGLIDAIRCANDAPGPDTINLAANGEYTLLGPYDTIDGANGLPPLKSEITINGNGATIARDTVSASAEFRIARVTESGLIVFNGLTISGGDARGIGVARTGGGILNAGGDLTFNACFVTANSARGEGGGIRALAGQTTIIASTVAGNAAQSGGGLVNDLGSVVTITNSTISGNTATQQGGGIVNDGSLSLVNSTVSDNTAGNGAGGIVARDGAMQLTNSIVANSVGGDCFADFGEVHDLGFNIIEDGSCISHVTSFSGDPVLGPLADNGGPTLTHALQPGSPAIDAGDCAGGTVLVDQRGVPRPQAAACDIGAFEVEERCDAGACPAGTVALVDAGGDFAGWCVGSSDPAHTDIYVDAVVPGSHALIEISKDFVAEAPITLTIEQVCADDTAAVPMILIADESITNLTGIDWPDFAWQLTGDDVWFDVPGSAQFRVNPPFATKTWDDFLDAPANQRARALRASDGVVVPYTSFFPGTGTGSLKIVADLAASDTPLFFELVETSSVIHASRMGDFDADGDTDLADFARFTQCFGGSGVEAALGCSVCDLDGDRDVDLSDFAVFSRHFMASR